MKCPVSPARPSRGFSLPVVSTSVMLLAIAFARPALAAPTAPSNLAATVNSATKITLTWADNATTETGYQIERRPSTSSTFTLVAQLPSNAKTYADATLSEGTKYYFRVRAIDATSSSRYSNAANATTKPKAPSALKAVATSLSLRPYELVLTWNDNSTVESGYLVEQATSSAGPWTEVASLTADTVSHVRQNLDPDQTYYFRVRGRSGQNYSYYTTTVSARTVPPRVADHEAPRGIYLLAQGLNASGLDDLSGLDQPFVDGLALRIGWDFLDTGTNAPAYDFSVIDEAIAAVQAVGKKLTLALFVLEAPEHVLASAGQVWDAPAISGGTTVRTVIPWDAAALADYRAMMAALASHAVWDASSGTMKPLRDHSALGQINAGIMGLQAVRDVSGSLIQQPGFTRAVFIQAMLGSVHAVRDNFPDKGVYVAFWGIDDGQEPDAGDEQLVALLNEFDGTRNPMVGLFNEALRGDSPGLYPYQGATLNGYYMLFQACGSWALQSLCNWSQGDTRPANGFAYGYDNFGARYYEIYQDDILTSAFASDFNLWHGILNAP